MKKLTCALWLTMAALLASTGCGKKEISSLQRKQAATLASEAEFAATLRDFTRAEQLLRQATELCPDTGAYWISLGGAHMRLNQRDQAKAAYQSALKAFERQAKEQPKDAEFAMEQVQVLALLGRVDDARKLLNKLVDRYPEERDVRTFVESNRLDTLLQDPAFKQLAL